MHLEEGQLEALLDGELVEAEALAARQHVAECAECRSALDGLQQDEKWLHGVLGALDHPLPHRTAREIIARATPQRSASWRWAAGMALLVVAAGTAYAIPGSPLRPWVDRVTGRSAGEPVARQESGAAGVSVEPGARFSIVFPQPQARGMVVVTLTDRPAIEARRSGVDSSATYSVEVDRLVIRAGGVESDFTLDIPRSAGWVEVLIGDRRVFLKDGQRIISDAPSDSIGRYRLSLSGGLR